MVNARAERGGEIRLIPIQGLPLIRQGDDLSLLLLEALARSGLRLDASDVLVLAQKIVSKSEGRARRLDDVAVSDRARDLAATVRKDPRLVELVLQESAAVLRAVPDVLIVEHRLGYIMANAGIDQSNIEAEDGETALLLPEDPDRSCAALRARLREATGAEIGVLINDSFGRPWRLGVGGVCLGAAGFPALVDRRGTPDLFGRRLVATEIGLADEVAAAASLVMGQADEAIPAVLVRGLGTLAAPDRPAADLVRPASKQLFR